MYQSAAGTSWNVGDPLYLGRRTLRVVGIRDEDADQPRVLVVGEGADLRALTTGKRAAHPGWANALDDLTTGLPRCREWTHGTLLLAKRQLEMSSA